MTLEKIKTYLDQEHGVFQGVEWLEMLAWCVNEIQTLELEKKSRLEAFVAMRGEGKKDG